MAKLVLPTLAFLVIAAFGGYAILDLAGRNGGDALLVEAARGDAPRLGNGDLARTHFTGIAALDDLVSILVRFFYPCASGERPALSVFTAYFAGQILALHTILLLEGMRAGNKRTLLYSPALWGLLYQVNSIGIALPIYCIAYLWLSPLGRTSNIASAGERLELLSMDPAKLSTVVGAMVLGLGLVTALPTLPSSLISADTRQIFLCIWQVFPLLISLWHQVLTLLVRIFRPDRKSASQTAAAKARSARPVYRQILVLTAAVHLTTVAFIALPRFRQALSGLSAEPISFENVFVPMSAFAPRGQVESVGQLAHTFLLYDMYCCVAAAFVLAASLSYEASGSSVPDAVQAVVKLVLRSVLVGPGGAALWSFWDRDEDALAAVEGARKRV